MKNINFLRAFALVVVFSTAMFVNAQTPTWQLKCEYNITQTYGSQNHYYDFDPGNEQNGAIINNSNYIRLTTNGGQTWTPEVVKPQMEVIKFVAPQTLLYAGFKKIYKSVDGGQNFTLVTDTVPNETPYSMDYSGNFVLIGSYAGRISYSNDGGQTWKNKRILQNALPFYEVRVISPTFAYALTTNIIFYTTDAGNTWTSINQLAGITVAGSNVTFPVSTLFSFLSFTAKDENNWLLSFQHNNSQYLYSTSNAGTSWTTITNKLPLVFGQPAEIGSLFSTSDGKVFASHNSSQGNNLYSGDFGASNFAVDSVDVNITMNKSYFKKINNKVYLLVRFSVSGVGAGYRIYTTNFSGSTSVSETTDNLHSFTIFPNPTNDILSVTNIPLGSSLKVLDVTGKIVYSSSMTSEQLTINTSNFTNGIYIIRIENNGQIANKQFVVNK